MRPNSASAAPRVSAAMRRGDGPGLVRIIGQAEAAEQPGQVGEAEPQPRRAAGGQSASSARTASAQASA